MTNIAINSESIAKIKQLQNTGNLERAETICRDLLKQDPEHSEALRLLGLLAHQTGHHKHAEDLIIRAIENQPSNMEAYLSLGIIYLKLERAVDAVKIFKDALLHSPNNLPCLVNLSNALIAIEEYDEAIQKSELALEIDPNCVEAMSNMGQGLSKIGRLTEAMSYLRKAVLLRPEDSRLINNLAFVEQSIGIVNCANTTYKYALSVNPNCTLAERNLLINSLNVPDITPQQLYDLHVEYGQKHRSNRVKYGKFNRRDLNVNRKLRVGYLSSDFHAHPVGFNILPVINNHNPNNVEVFIYSQNEINDEVCKQFKSRANKWIKIDNKSDAEVALQIEEDKIDILVFLAGRFNSNRPTICTLRPAPVQISFHDCATTGLPEMDFWLTDSFLHPKNTREFFTEKLYRLPNFYQFNAPDDFPKVSVPPVKETGFITFGSFNKPEKINDVVIKLWAKILNEVPGSRLLMKYGAYFNDPILVDYWQDKFSQFGVDNDCLIFNDQNTDRISHLKTYSHIDIALDPFPFNGATTTFEALAMGVPVITLAGNSFVSRVGGSLLKNLNLDNLIADTQEEYVRLARNLAFDVDTTEKLRKSLRSTLSNSDLCQGKTYTQTLEAAYRNMWTKWCVSFKRKKPQ